MVVGRGRELGGGGEDPDAGASRVALTHAPSLPERPGAVAADRFRCHGGSVSATRTRPDRTADERTQLLGWFDLQRGIVRLKCEGLSDEGASRGGADFAP